MPAINSKFSEFADGGDLVANDIVVGLRSGINTRFVFKNGVGIYLPLAGGVMAGDIDMASHKIVQVPTPTNPTDAANKAYVDSAVSGSVNPGLINELAWYAANGSVVSGLATVNNAVLTTDSGGVPTWVTTIGLSKGGTNANLTAVNGGIVYSGASALAISAAGTANQLLLSGGAGAPTWLTNIANAVLTTDGAGVPIFSTTLPSGITVTGYLPLAGGAMTGQIDMGGLNIVNLANPTAGQDACTKSYADSIAAGISVKVGCQAATTANLNATQAGAGVGATLTNAGAQAAFSVDGYSASLNDRILVKDQTLTQHNGIYTVTTLGDGVTNWVLTRATDYDTPAEIIPGNLVPVNFGTVNAGTGWLQTAVVVTVDTDPILFSPFSIVTAGTGLTKSGNVISLISPVALNLGGTNAALTASDGGIVYSTGSALAVLAATATARQVALSGSNSAPSWSPYALPAAAGAAGNVMTSDGTDWISSAPADTNVTITDDTSTNAVMYPTWVTANSGVLPLKVTSTKLFYNPSTSLLTNIGALGQITNIQSSAGLKCLEFGYTASAVNYLKIYNSTTSNAPVIEANGTDLSVGIAIQTKNGHMSLTDGTSTIAPSLRWFNAANTKYVGFKAGTLAGNTIWTLPTSDGSSGYVMQTDGAGNLSFVQQNLINIESAVVSITSGTTLIPFDNTTPQITEGFSIGSCSITPTNAANTLEIEIVANANCLGSAQSYVLACFQGATANAIKSSAAIGHANDGYSMVLRHTMVAGTTSPITFSFRMGGNNGANAITVGGYNGGGILNGTSNGLITIKEYSV